MWVLLPTLTHTPSSSSQLRSLCQVPMSRVNKAPISRPEKQLRLLACLTPQELLSHPPWAACELSPFPQPPFLLQRHPPSISSLPRCSHPLSLTVSFALVVYFLPASYLLPFSTCSGTRVLADCLPRLSCRRRQERSPHAE